MSFAVPTPDDFVARFATFANASSPTVASALAEAQTRVDDTWTAGDYPLGLMLYAAHVLTLDGFGTGAEAALGAAGALSFQTLRSGSLHLDRRPASDGAQASSLLNDTTYGRRFLALLRVNRSAVLVP